jgi:hypothetical protein
MLSTILASLFEIILHSIPLIVEPLGILIGNPAYSNNPVTVGPKEFNGPSVAIPYEVGPSTHDSSVDAVFCVTVCGVKKLVFAIH